MTHAKQAPAPCGVRRAYRGLSDIGSREVCGNPGIMPSGRCRLHDPETRPKRDRKGRIVKREQTPPTEPQKPTPQAPRVVRCAEYDDPAAQCGACDAGFPRTGPNHTEPRVVAFECWTCGSHVLARCYEAGHDVRPAGVGR